MNQNYKKLRSILAALMDEPAMDDMIFDALDRAWTPVSKSRLHGWGVSPEHKHYRRMSADEFGSVLDAVIRYINAYRCAKCGYIIGKDWLDDGHTCPKCKLVQ
jgi:lipopolysaccharide biosynthesis regulator YciM